MPDDKNFSLEEFISTNEEIDVAEIMTAVQKRIQEKKDAGILKQSEIEEIVDMELLPLPDFLEVPNVFQPLLYPGDPYQDENNVYHPREATIEREEGTGIRGLIKKILIKIRSIFFPLIRFMTRPIYNELKQYTAERFNENGAKIFDNEKSKQLVFQSKEYIKLLHNSMNNLIVELSKQKIDAELLKTKIKVLEDKIEFLENRERAIEKKLFPKPDSQDKPGG